MMLTIIVAALITIFVLSVGGITTTVGAWYQDLRKPSWTPPNWIFAPAWTLILALAAWAGVLAWTQANNSSERWGIALLFGIVVLLVATFGHS